MNRTQLCAVAALLILPLQAAYAQTSSTQPRSAQPEMPSSLTGRPQPQATPPQQSLTLQQAEQIALQNHPQVQAATYLAYAAKEQVTETRSAYFPLVNGNASGSYAENDSRIGAGELNSPRVFDRYGNGISVNQLITDFGRTHELVKSSNQHAQAQQQNVASTRQDVLLQVDQAYFDVLKSQALLNVAQQTVNERQTASDQITELQKNQLRSGLDVSFANVQLAQAKLLLIQTQNNLQASFAELSAALGYANQQTFQLTEEPLPAAPDTDISTLLDEAIRNRPDLIGQRYNLQSAQSYATAERDLWFPTLSGVAVAGLIPVIAPGGLPPTTLPGSRYAAAGFNLNIPIFNGHQFGALHAEANYQAQAQNQYLRDLQDRIVRDVRTAWLNANSEYQRLAVTQQLLDEANQSLELAQSRYQLGLSSIVELTQAQLNQTQAEIDAASAKYDFETDISVLNFQIGVRP